MIFLLISVAVFNLAAIFIPKRISLVSIYGTVFFTISFQNLVDIYLSLRYDLYGYFNTGVDFKTLIVILGIYPAVNIIIVNFFPKKGIVSRIIYIVALSAFSVAYEWILLQVGVFNHSDQWHLWYSAIIYPFLLLGLLLNLKLLKWTQNKG